MVTKRHDDEGMDGQKCCGPVAVGKVCFCGGEVDQGRAKSMEDFDITRPYGDRRLQFSALMDVLSCTFYRCEVSLPWKMSFLSQDVDKLTGYPAGELEEMGWSDLVHPDDLGQVRLVVEEAVRDRHPFRITYRIVHRSGAVRHVREQGHAIYGSDGEAQFLEGMITDITDEQDLRQKTSDASERANITAAKLTQVLEGTSDCIISLDRDWQLTYLNERAEKEISDGAELCGRRIMDAFPQLEQTPFWPAYQTAMRDRKSGQIVGFMPGLNHWYEAQAEPTDEGITVFFRNIDDRKSAEEAALDREDRLRRTLAYVPQMIWSTRPDGFHDYYSPLWYEFTGVSERSTDGNAWNNLLHADDRERAVTVWHHSLQTGDPYEIEYRLRHHTGEFRWVLARANPEKDERGKILRWHGTCTDIHEGLNAQHAWHEARTLQQSLLDASADCIKLINTDGEVVFINEPGIRSMELRSLETVQGKPWASLWPSESLPAVHEALNIARSGRDARFTGLCPTASGKPRWWDVVVSPVKNRQGEVDRLLAISRDITEQRETARELKRASEEDALTNLSNRRAFETRLRAATIRAMQSGGQVAVLLLDLDHFKHVNDTLGHPAGDRLLTVFARRLQKAVRSSDFVARLGGDEFAIIMEAPDGNVDPQQIGSDVVSRLQRPVLFEGQAISAGVSIGGAVFPDNADNANELLKHADIALFTMKESGRGGIQMFEIGMLNHANRVASQMSLARSALTEISIEPHYQPKVDLRSGRIAGMEALLRWRHGTHGLQLPDTVSEAFKDYELAAKIGEFMQRKVFSDLRGWLDCRLPVGFVAINASPAEFLRDDFAEKFLERMEENSVPPSLVEVEVTEHVFLQRGSDFVSRALGLLNKAGVRIALDDFGTGHSSLSHLRDYPVDVLKIDRSFVDRMTNDREVRAIISAVVMLAKSLKIDVVAEGIETESQKELLLQDGCGLGQGFYFGRAIQAEDVPHLFQGKLKRLAA